MSSGVKSPTPENAEYQLKYSASEVLETWFCRLSCLSAVPVRVDEAGDENIKERTVNCISARPLHRRLAGSGLLDNSWVGCRSCQWSVAFGNGSIQLPLTRSVPLTRLSSYWGRALDVCC